MEEVLQQAQALAAEVSGAAGGEAPIHSVYPLASRTRKGLDAKRSALAVSGKLLKSAPAVKGNYFKVASILE